MKRILKLSTMFVLITILLTFFGFQGIAKASTNKKTQQEAVSFIQSKIGQSIDNDKHNGAQCVDLAQIYYAYLGHGNQAGGNGKDFKNNCPSGWTKIPYYSGFSPEPGDVVVWTATTSTAGQEYGHVAVAISGSTSNITVVEQSSGKVRQNTYSYTYGTFWGVIRPDFPANNNNSWSYMYYERARYRGIGKNAAVKAQPYLGSDVETFEQYTTKEFIITAAVKNKYDNIWYQLESGGYIYSGDVTYIESLATFTTSGTSSPSGTLKQGNPFYNNKGTITSSDCLVKMTSAIYMADGITLQQGPYTATINGTTTCQYSMKGSPLANNMHFGDIPAGNYIYRVTAYHGTHGKSSTVIETTFSITKTGQPEATDFTYNKTADLLMPVMCTQKELKEYPYADSNGIKNLSGNERLTLVGKYVNKYGNTWYAVQGGGFVNENNISFLSPTITASSIKKPSGALVLGDVFGIRGVIATDTSLYMVKTQVTNRSTSQIVLSKVCYPSASASSVNLNAEVNGVNLNLNMAFASLPVGDYIYQCFVQTGYKEGNLPCVGNMIELTDFYSEFAVTSPEPSALPVDLKVYYRDQNGLDLLPANTQTCQPGDTAIYAATINGYKVDADVKYVYVDAWGANPAEIVFTYTRIITDAPVLPVNLQVYYRDQNGFDLLPAQTQTCQPGDTAIYAALIDGYKVDADVKYVYVDAWGANPAEIIFYYTKIATNPSVTPTPAASTTPTITPTSTISSSPTPTLTPTPSSTPSATPTSDIKNGFFEKDGYLCYYTNGEIDTARNGLALDSVRNAWYFCALGRVQSQYSGLAEYGGEWFYLENGKLNTTRAGLVTYDGGRFMIAAGRILREYNGLILEPNTQKWYYVAAGQVADYTGLVLYDGAWFYVVNGELGVNYTGEVQYNGATFYVVGGQLVA